MGRPLAGVLVSISGANFRQNMFTNDEGNIIYHSLVSRVLFTIIIRKSNYLNVLFSLILWLGK